MRMAHNIPRATGYVFRPEKALPMYTADGWRPARTRSTRDVFANHPPERESQPQCAELERAAVPRLAFATTWDLLRKSCAEIDTRICCTTAAVGKSRPQAAGGMGLRKANDTPSVFVESPPNLASVYRSRRLEPAAPPGTR